LTIEELRTAIEARLRRPLHGVIWLTLTISAEIDEYALDGNVDDAVSLYQRAESVVAQDPQASDGLGPRPYARTESVEMDTAHEEVLRDEEQRAAVARAEYLARAASFLPTVRALRAEVRPDRRLSREEAETLLRSPSGPRIRALASDLAERYRWPRDHAVRFLLSDEIPLAAPLTPFEDEHDYDYGHVTLTAVVEPWVSAETVTRVYRSAQQRLTGRQRHYLRKDALDVLRFCMNQLEADGSLPPWQQLVEAWNGKHQSDGERYENASAIRKAFLSAEQTLIPTPLRIARRGCGRPPTKATKAPREVS
jgi:hypothetical protein